MSELLEVFNDAPSVEVEDNSEAASAEGESTETTSDSEENAEVTEEKPAETEAKDPEEETEKQSWTFAAVKDERGKRQEAEEREKRLLAEIEQLKKPKEDAPSVFEDEEGFKNHFKQELTQEVSNAKLEMARTMMMEFHDDYEQMETQFIELAKGNPILTDQAIKSSNPAKFVYEQAKKYQEYQQIQNIDEYKAKIKAEALAELEKSREAQQAEESEKTLNLSPSLAKARGSASQDEKLSENPGDLFD